MTALVLGLPFVLLLHALLCSSCSANASSAATATAGGFLRAPAGGSRWLGEEQRLVGVGHVLPNFLLVKLEVVWIGVRRRDDDSNISRNVEREPLQPGLPPCDGVMAGARGKDEGFSCVPGPCEQVGP